MRLSSTHSPVVLLLWATTSVSGVPLWPSPRQSPGVTRREVRMTTRSSARWHGRRMMEGQDFFAELGTETGFEGSDRVSGRGPQPPQTGHRESPNTDADRTAANFEAFLGGHFEAPEGRHAKTHAVLDAVPAHPEFEGPGGASGNEQKIIHPESPNERDKQAVANFISNFGGHFPETASGHETHAVLDAVPAHSELKGPGGASGNGQKIVLPESLNMEIKTAGFNPDAALANLKYFLGGHFQETASGYEPVDLTSSAPPVPEFPGHELPTAPALVHNPAVDSHPVAGSLGKIKSSKPSDRLGALGPYHRPRPNGL